MGGNHPLGKRGKKSSQGIIVVRFELPWPIWCSSCESHIAKGKRFNAEKKQNGNYYSTKIWEFSMKCHLCDGLIVMRTDPQNRDYAVVSGAKRKTMEYDADDAKTIAVPDKEEKKRLETDALFALEHK